MFAPMIAPGTTPDLSGVYFTTNPASLNALLTDGVVAVVGRSSSGPVGSFQRITDISQVARVYGSGIGVDVAERAFVGGARELLYWRLSGTSAGTKATKTINDSAAVASVRLDAADVGARAYAYHLVDSLANTDMVELGIYVDGTLYAVVTFHDNASSGGVGEPQLLVNALNAAGLPVVGTKLADGSKILARAATATAFTVGTDPVPDGGAHTAAMAALEGQTWNVAVFDSEDTAAIQPSIVDWVRLLESKGLYRFVVLGDNTSTLASRQGRAVGFNRWNLLYVVDDLTDNGVLLDGARAAGQVAGLKAAAGIADTIGGAVMRPRLIDKSVTLPTPLGVDDIRATTQAGALTFTLDPLGNVVVSEDVTTYTVTDGIRDVGLFSQSYVVSRFYRLQERIAAVWATRVRKVENNRFGQSTVVGDAKRELQKMIDLGYFSGGTSRLSPSRPPSGKYAWVEVAPIVQQKMAVLVGIMQYS